MFLVALSIILLLLCFLLFRFRLRMAALVAWLVGSITGAKREESTPKQTRATGRNRPKSRIRGAAEEPSFSTNLTTPIEEVIEESLIEEVTEPKPQLKKRSRKPKKPVENDEIGFSFFQAKLKRSGTEPELVDKPSTNSLPDHPETSQFDPVGFSFIPVKDKKGRKTVTKKETVEELPKSTIIEHYNSKKPHRKVETIVTPVTQKKDIIKENCIEIVNKPTGKVVYVEIKESKKVISNISYAAITSHKYDLSNDQQVNKETETNLVNGTETDSNWTFINQSEVLVNGQPPQLLNGTRENSEVDEVEEVVCQKVIVKELYDNTVPTEVRKEDFVEAEKSNEQLERLAQEILDEPNEILNINKDHSVEDSRFNVIHNQIVDNKNQKLIELDEEYYKSEIVENLTGTQQEIFSDKYSQIDLEIIENSKACEIKVEGNTHKRLYFEENINEDSKNNSEVVDNLRITENKFYDNSNNQQVEIETEQVNHHSEVTENWENIQVNRSSEIQINNEEFNHTINSITISKVEISESKLLETTQQNLTQTYSDSFKNIQISEHNSEGFVTVTNTVEEQPVIYKQEEQNSEELLRVTETLEEYNTISQKQESDDFSRVTEIHNVISAINTQEKLISGEFSQETCEPHQVFSVSEEQKSEEFLATNSVCEEESKMSAGQQQVRVLTLNDKEHQDSTLYRIEKNWILQFRIGPSLMGRQISFYCNYPKTGDKFERHTYNLLNWEQDEGCNNSDDTSLSIQIKAKIAGSYHYYFTYNNDDEHQGSGFFLVDPILKYGKNEDLPLDSIQCQTVLAKSLGTFESWENKLRVAKESGYNMIHFTPIQELGASNSSYSLSGQLKVNPIFTKQNGETATFDDVEKLIAKLRDDWKMTSICDIVLNHTANESAWLQDHPEATYNCSNCPYMRPAYLLDAALYQFSVDVSKGLYDEKGIPIEVCTEDHLNSIRYHLHTDVLSKINLQEMFICDVNKNIAEFSSFARNKVQPTTENCCNEELVLIQDPQYRRFATTVDIKLALKLYNVYRSDCFDEETRMRKCVEEFKRKLDSLNNQKIEVVNNHLNAAVENCIAGIQYFRVQHDGPKIKEVSVKNPLVFRYFTDYGSPKNVKEHEEIMYSDNGRFLMAHNGWVMNSDPLKNFASPDSNIYIRRELIAWGDSVKLRYGDKPADCPFLWQHMKAYVEQTAKIFDGIRLDNCHSTPIPLAEYLLDAARKVRPDLYVGAELFTNSDMTDNIFVNRLGITSLIREAMSAWDSHEQGRLVYRYGGCPVGSFYQPNVRPLVPSIAHALFLDLTHDNPSPVEKRSVFDLLPSTALVNMACCASGSNRGYDELVPHHIHVVDETRQYTEWTDDQKLAAGNARYVTSKSGIIAAKKALNQLHCLLGAKGFNQVYVDQMDPDIVAVTRHCPETHESYVLVAFTAFGHPSQDSANHQRGIKPLRVEGELDEIVLEATFNHINKQTKYAKFENYAKDSKWINGLAEYQVEINEHLQAENSTIFEKVNSGDPNTIQLNFKNFKPGSIAIIKVSLPKDMKEAVSNVRNLIKQFSVKKDSELSNIISALTLPDLNRALYRCGQEEQDEGHGFDTYNIPDFGNLVYAGLQGFISLLSKIRPQNDLGHPMCKNLRDGNWMIDYIWQRLKLDEGTCALGQWLEENTKHLKSIPRYLIPCYFDIIVTGVYIQLLEQSYNLMANFVKNGSTFVKALSLGSLQFAAYIKSADLPTLSPNLAPPKPPQRKNDKGELVQACVTLSAGLPHFSTGYMRNWGRDTFIALRGLFILTGRFDDAKYHILGYGACLRHGLIPNLLDGGRNSRFNCRDAVWWWLYCIKCYCEDAPNGISILKDKISRLFPHDDAPPQPPGQHEQTLAEVIQEALQVHFQGLVFRERNAGKQIDEHMTEKGFNNQIGIHPETGFVFGGNVWNCGTWMDKMGSSDKAGIRGKPATPRDGSAIELIGLSKAVITWLAKLNQQKLYDWDGVERTNKSGNVIKWTFISWAEKIQNNFEKYFYVNEVPVENEIRPDLINKRAIYKDCYGASQEWTDFQLRCNFPIAMVAAPELFNPKHAWLALQQTEKYLLGPLGMKTLDPDDWTYNGVYDNANDSTDSKLAHGFNYHQGPEWVWPVGFFLRAKLHFAALNGELEKTIAETKIVLSKHFVELQTSDWKGLPELTNKDGSFCYFSSRTQAWSMSSILEVLYDLQKQHQQLPSSN